MIDYKRTLVRVSNLNLLRVGAVQKNLHKVVSAANTGWQDIELNLPLQRHLAEKSTNNV